MERRVHWSLYPAGPNYRRFPNDASNELLGALVSCGIGNQSVVSLCSCMLNPDRLINVQSFDVTVYRGGNPVNA